MMEIGVAIMEAMSKDDYAVWAVTSYFSWSYLCEKKHNTGGDIKEVDIDFARSFLEDFRGSCKAVRCIYPLGVQVGEKSWKLPPFGVFRLDVDANVDVEKNLYGLGVVIRDRNGNLRAAASRPSYRPISILDTEIDAILFGLDLCNREGLCPVMIYSDSLTAVRSMKVRQETGNFFEIEMIPVANALRTSLILSFNHMYRSANMIAHSLARFGARSEIACTWNCIFPQWLRSLMNA